ncbi:MAG: superoxide dismutase [Ni] [Candidatus Omnitrophota bacterium]
MRNNRKRIGLAVVFLSLIVCTVFSVKTFSHCQIPCGIYDDDMRIAMLKEDILTLEKSMKSIEELSKDPAKNANQLIRWVQNKDAHAEKIDEIVTQYFMTQRIKPAEESDAKAYAEYTKKLVLLHNILIASLKSKQTTDLANVEKLNSLVDQFAAAYFGPDHKPHSH